MLASTLIKIRKIIEDRRENASSHIEALEKIINVRYSNEDDARKRLYAIELLLDILEQHGNIDEDVEGRLLKQEILADGTILREMLLSVAKTKNKTPEDILRIHEYDPLQYSLSKHTLKIYNAYSKKDGVQELMSSSVVAKPLQNKLSEDALRTIYASLEPAELDEYEYTYGNKKMLEFPIMDLHLGKFSWAREVGEDYDLEIASNIFLNSIQELLARIKRHQYKFDKILFPVGQDFYNFDDDNNKTTAGTPQDTDTRWQKMFERGNRILIAAIKELRKLAPVDVCYIQGNHDYKMSYFTVHNLATYYKDTDSITVNMDIKPRKYYEFGNCMIGYTHGNKETKKRLTTIMQAEAPEMWGRTKYRELHMGHLHSEHVTEIQGFKQRRISSVTSVDRWHKEKGYIGVVRQMQAFVWDYDYGLENIYNIVTEKVMEDNFGNFDY